jgi:hypothetical protein
MSELITETNELGVRPRNVELPEIDTSVRRRAQAGGFRWSAPSAFF